MHSLVWSYGGGVQSAAIGVLIREGVLPKPDLAVIADTGREVATTWEYLANVMQPYLGQIGLKIQIAPHTLSRVDLYAPDGLTLMPAYTPEGRIPGYCSGEWKRDVVERWLRLQGVKTAEEWIGFSVDEMHRAKKDHRPWLRLSFPLIERMINRAMCVAIIQGAGLPVPDKSRCWQCPHQDAREWTQVKARPEEWQMAVALDRQIREQDPLQAGLYLHSSRVPLELADLATDGLQPPSRPCETGNCWT